MQLLKLSICDIESVTGESKSVIYAAIKCSHLPTFLVGRRRFAKPAAVSAWIDFLQAESEAGRPVQYLRRPRQVGLLRRESAELVGKKSGGTTTVTRR